MIQKYAHKIPVIVHISLLNHFLGQKQFDCYVHSVFNGRNYRLIIATILIIFFILRIALEGSILTDVHCFLLLRIQLLSRTQRKREKQYLFGIE